MNLKQAMQGFLTRSKKAERPIGAWSDEGGALGGLFPLCFIPEVASVGFDGWGEMLTDAFGEISADLPSPAELATH